MAEEPKTEQEVVEIFQRLMEQRDSLSTAAIERRSDIAEHDLVIKTLEKVDDDRRCHRLIGDVMVERSKKTVLPEVVENRNNLAALVKTYEEKLEEKQREVLAFQKKYNIRIKGEDSAGPAKADKKAAPTSQGVLV
ncbi:hypothetical protein H632_c1048p0 [Helicosporidium sp. ATCC 50920]|nr:hypothetical protein H632_c1048p0 [Helicosporidium sp. ATCC 50920]|eukprot:KDD74828.1 hypothetical protein H632_c1048p0 [Helicosporidium sp. ATCC 50920]